MPYHEFIWTPQIVEHLADNDITTDEFEKVVCDPDYYGSSHSSGRPCAFGNANDGRRIICVYELVDDLQVLPVTAYEIGEIE